MCMYPMLKTVLWVHFKCFKAKSVLTQWYDCSAGSIVTRVRAVRSWGRGSMAPKDKTCISGPKVLTGSGSHPAPCTLGIQDCLYGDKVTGALNWPLTLI
jgi:hypothetical protein